MALSETVNETGLCNRSLGRIGANQIKNVETDTTVPAIQCRLHYEPTRDALQRSHKWRFARDRSELEQDDTDPDFEWDNQFSLPADFVRFISVFEEEATFSRHRRHAIEGSKYLTNFDTVSLRYVKKVTDVTEFDSLYTEILVLQLALKLLGPLAGGDKKLRDTLQGELKPLIAKAQAVDSDETNVGGRSDWNLARHGGLGITGVSERLL